MSSEDDQVGAELEVYIDDDKNVDDSPEDVDNSQENENVDNSPEDKNTDDDKNVEQMPKPLTEEDVLQAMAKMSILSDKDVNEICDGYAQKMKSLINCVKKSLNPKTDEEEFVELDRIMRIINMCPKDEFFIRTKDKIWFARYHILDRNSNWFLNRDYSSSIKKDHKQRMIETMIRMIQSRWKKLSTTEQELYWEKAFQMLHIVARFKKLTGE